MERPDIRKPLVGPGKPGRLLATTQSIEEAERIAQQYELEGFMTWITRKTQGQITLYEIWGSKEPQIFEGKGKPVLRE